MNLSPETVKMITTILEGEWYRASTQAASYAGSSFFEGRKADVRAARDEWLAALTPPADNCCPKEVSGTPTVPEGHVRTAMQWMPMPTLENHTCCTLHACCICGRTAAQAARDEGEGKP